MEAVKRSHVMWKKKVPTATYDAERFQPAVKTSICTGERVAGLIEKDTRKFHDIRLIRSDKELAAFCREYGVTEDELKRIV